MLTVDYVVDLDVTVAMFAIIYRYSVTYQRKSQVPRLCQKFYTLPPSTLKVAFHDPENALHKHGCTYLTEYNCDVAQLLSILLPGQLKSRLHALTAEDDIP